MKRMRRRRERRSLVVPISLFLIFLAILSSAAYFLKNTIEPNLEEIGKMRGRTMVTRMVNNAINDQFREEVNTENLIIRSTNDKGETEMIQADTKAMNILITEISKELQEEYMKVKPDRIKVPLGAVLGSQILSEHGPDYTVRVLPLTVSGIDFKTEFEAKGINQTKYKVYIILKSQVKVLSPLASSTFDMSSTILIAEAVILGGVPDSYVKVPKEDILDVTDE